MKNKNFSLWNKLAAAVVFLVSAVTYLSTIEPSASFWDCGEFIASSYKLEVGHPPGNPVFQLFARFFTMFGDGSSAAILVNSMSAICSALTILLLYLTIVFFVKRLVKKDERGEYSLAGAIAVIGSGAVGALAYCFSDTFWFSAVEGEVYAMSSLFTALVFWAMTKWYEVADQPYANRWIVLISFLMGLSIGVHLLNLLAVPAIVFMYYYKKREDGNYSPWELVRIMLVSVVILAVTLFLIIPYLPKVAAYFDLLFVNVFHLPYNSGAIFFMVVLLAACFWGLFRTFNRNKVFLNTALLCFTTITIGFSLFSICIIRSSVKTPTNEYQPDNAFTLVRYLSREQYGSNPLVYGEYFDAPYEVKEKEYWAPLNGRYEKTNGPISPMYKPEGKMLFPRMWSNSPTGTYEEFYERYMDGKGKTVAGATHKKPTMAANLAYFFDYQLNWMYWRYFMWNFVGRQNDVHSPSPGNVFHGNWESGIKFIDEMRLGDQEHAPSVLADNKAKNHYFFLPLLLGLLGLFFQFGKDKRGCWLVFLMFFMTGIAIVIYLNQPPYQVRERDYAYAGSFYSFCIWIGMAVAAIYSWIADSSGKKTAVATAVMSTLACLCVPALMAAENWDDHDRSNRRTAVELATNYLNSVGPGGILITHGDNDTFPLWYAQEVEGVRTDVRICNTSLLGTDWHIDQMKYAVNESAPLDLSLPYESYLYGTNEYIYLYDTRNQVIDIKDVMTVFRHPDAKLSLTSGKKVDYIMSRKISVPVNKENALKSGVVSPLFANAIPDSIVLEIPQDKDYITKPELFLLDLLSNYQWDRPLNMLNMGGELNIGIKDYLMNDGFSYRLSPIKCGASTTKIGVADPDYLFHLLNDVYKFDALSADDYFIDYQNKYSFLGVMSVPGVFTTGAEFFIALGQKERAKALLDKCMDVMRNYPVEGIAIGLSGTDYTTIALIDDYYAIGCNKEARELAVKYAEQLLDASRFFMEFYRYGRAEYDQCNDYVGYLLGKLRKNGEDELADQIRDTFNGMVDQVNGMIGEKSEKEAEG